MNRGKAIEKAGVLEQKSSQDWLILIFLIWFRLTTFLFGGIVCEPHPIIYFN
jgi:hypothetical protein